MNNEQHYRFLWSQILLFSLWVDIILFVEFLENKPIRIREIVVISIHIKEITRFMYGRLV